MKNKFNPDQLRQFRLSRGLNQTEFAKFFGVSQEAISMYESGLREIPQHLIDVIKSFPPSDIDTAAEKYSFEKTSKPLNRCDMKTLIYEAFEAGAIWQRDQKESSTNEK